MPWEYPTHQKKKRKMRKASEQVNMTREAQGWRFPKAEISSEAGRNAENQNQKENAKQQSIVYTSKTRQDHVKGRRAREVDQEEKVHKDRLES